MLGMARSKCEFDPLKNEAQPDCVSLRSQFSARGSLPPLPANRKTNKEGRPACGNLHRGPALNGGLDGEEISAPLIRALPQHLSNRGSFHGHLLLSDRRGAPAEFRVREMLGTDEQQFDVALLTLLEETPAAFLGEAGPRLLFGK